MRARCLALAVVSLTAGCAVEGFPEPPGDVLNSPEARSGGAGLYQKNCSICHGARGYGDGPQARSLDPAPADLRSLSGPRSDPGYWFFRIKEGGKTEPLARPRSAMPAWGEHMSDEEIWQLVAYLKAWTDGRA